VPNCGITLKDWEINDSAWEEDGDWSLKCIFVVYIKGAAFVLDKANRLKTAQAL